MIFNEPNLFQLFQENNLQRCVGPFDCANKSNLYWGVAIAEEAGEVAGAIKKMDRGVNARDLKKWIKKFKASDSYSAAPIPPDSIIIDEINRKRKQSLSDELADLFIYMDLLAQKNNIDLGMAVTKKFNEVNAELGCEELNLPTQI